MRRTDRRYGWKPSSPPLNLRNTRTTPATQKIGGRRRWNVKSYTRFQIHSILCPKSVRQRGEKIIISNNTTRIKFLGFRKVFPFSPRCRSLLCPLHHRKIMELCTTSACWIKYYVSVVFEHYFELIVYIKYSLIEKVRFDDRGKYPLTNSDYYLTFIIFCLVIYIMDLFYVMALMNEKMSGGKIISLWMLSV